MQLTAVWEAAARHEKEKKTNVINELVDGQLVDYTNDGRARRG